MALPANRAVLAAYLLVYALVDCFAIFHGSALNIVINHKVFSMSSVSSKVGNTPVSRLLRHLSLMTLVEGTSLIALVLIAVPIKYGLDFPLAVQVVGPIHGALFLWTMGALLTSVFAGRLAATKGAVVFCAALIPFGGLWSHRLLDREIARQRQGVTQD